LQQTGTRPEATQENSGGKTFEKVLPPDPPFKTSWVYAAWKGLRARELLMAAQGAVGRMELTSYENSLQSVCVAAHPRPLRAAERQKVLEGGAQRGKPLSRGIMQQTHKGNSAMFPHLTYPFLSVKWYKNGRCVMSLCRHSSPESRYVPSPLINLSDSSERERLSPSAIKAYFNILDRWKIGELVGRDLLGGISRGQFYNLRQQGVKKPLDQDKLQRVSCLVGIFKALNILFSEQLADTWVNLPNKNRIFRGAAPIDFMATGGIPSMLVVRRLLDARRGGV
jgi:hypothetical protein